MSNLKNSNSYAIYRRLIQVAGPYWIPFVLGQCGNAIIAISDGLLTYHIKSLSEKGFIARDEHFILWLPFIVVVFFLIRGIATFCASYFMARMGNSVVRDFRKKIVAHLIKLPALFYDKNVSATLLSKINYDTEQVSDALGEAITSMIRGAFTTVSMLIVMLTLNYRVTILLLVIIPILGYYINKVSKKMRRQSAHIQTSMGEVMHVATEIVNHHKIIRIFEGEQYENQRFKLAAGNNWRKQLKMVSTSAISVAGMQFIGACALAVFLFLATLKPGNVVGTAMSSGDFLAMAVAILGLLRPIKQISVVNTTLQRGIAAAKSIFDLLDEPLEIDQGLLKLDSVKGRVEFKNVKFHYPNHEEYVLHDISFSVNQGETIALVGRSGSGKSTLVNLLARFYTVQEGGITIDGQEIQDIALKSLRHEIALVTQHVQLFNDTIANNIAYGSNRGASTEAIIQAARLAHAWEFIESLPLGLETEIGENGMRLSGGQRQRLAIARAMLKNAPILILDEATSALDTESESHIQAALESLMKGRTTFVIAHRLSTIKKANKIIMLEHGRIIESGTHAELMSQNGRYAALQQAQFPHA